VWSIGCILFEFHTGCTLFQVSCKMNDLQCAYFMSKSVFELHGCRALTLALARLSCNLRWFVIFSLSLMHVCCWYL